MKNLAVIIPVFNEEESIKSVVESINKIKIKDYKLQPIVVNDASTDNSKELIKKLDCILIDLPVNLGIGGAMQSGYIYAKSRNYDYALQFDGDGQHPEENIEKLIREIENNDCNIIIGSRFIDKKGFQSTGIRRFGIKYLRNIIKLFTGKNITDSTSGFRLFDKKAIAIAAKNYPDEYPEPESIILFLKRGLKIKEVAVEMKERRSGKSSIRYFNQLYYIIKVSLAIFYTFIKT